MTVVLATLHLQGALANLATVTSGTNGTVPCTSPGLRDGSDATYYRMQIAGDEFTRGIATFAFSGQVEEFTLDPEAVIERVTLRARGANSTGQVGAYATVDGDVFDIDVPGTLGWVELAFAADPATSESWTPATLSGRILGFKADLDTLVVDELCRVDIMEFEVLVEGAAAPTVVYGSAHQHARQASSSDAGIITVLDGYRVSPTPLPGYVEIPQPGGSNYRLKPYPPSGYAAVKNAADANASLGVQSIRSKNSVDANGAINYCAVQDLQGSWPLARTGFSALVAVHSLPAQKASPDEIHPFLTLFRPFGVETLRFGVTPSGRLACRIKFGEQAAGPSFIYHTTTLLSPLGTVAADGVFRTFAVLDSYAGVLPYGPALLIDGQLIVHSAMSNYTDIGILEDDPARLRMMLFNGPDGITRMDHSIAYVRAFDQGHDELGPTYPFDDDPSGVAIRLHEFDVNGEVDPAHGASGQNRNLTMRTLVDGEFGFPLAWGSTPAGTLQWTLRPGYTQRPPIATSYRPIIGGSVVD